MNPLVTTTHRRFSLYPTPVKKVAHFTGHAERTRQARRPGTPALRRRDPGALIGQRRQPANQRIEARSPRRDGALGEVQIRIESEQLWKFRQAIDLAAQVIPRLFADRRIVPDGQDFRLSGCAQGERDARQDQRRQPGKAFHEGPHVGGRQYPRYRRSGAARYFHSVTAQSALSQRSALLAVLAATVLGFALRVPGLWSDFWLDEIWTFNLAASLDSARQVVLF